MAAIETVRMWARRAWDAIYPPRLSRETEQQVRSASQDADAQARKVAEKFEDISNRAEMLGEDPIAVLVHEVRAASLREAIKREADDGGEVKC